MAVVDDLKAGSRFLGGVVAASTELENLSFDRILITADGARVDILESFLKRGVFRDQILLLE